MCAGGARNLPPTHSLAPATAAALSLSLSPLLIYLERLSTRRRKSGYRAFPTFRPQQPLLYTQHVHARSHLSLLLSLARACVYVYKLGAVVYNGKRKGISEIGLHECDGEAGERCAAPPRNPRRRRG